MFTDFIVSRAWQSQLRQTDPVAYSVIVGLPCLLNRSDGRGLVKGSLVVDIDPSVRSVSAGTGGGGASLEKYSGDRRENIVDTHWKLLISWKMSSCERSGYFLPSLMACIVAWLTERGLDGYGRSRSRPASKDDDAVSDALVVSGRAVLHASYLVGSKATRN